jgi:transcriptional regulator with XRE-family HTH domain
MAITEIQKTNLKELGLRIKSVREAKGLSLQALGYEVDKDPQSISRVEMGNVNPSYLYLLEISRGLKVDIETLLTG